MGHIVSMPNRSSKKKRPADVNALAASIVGDAVGDKKAPIDYGNKNPAAVELGRLGGKKGGFARAKSLSPERRHEIAQKAAEARWSNARKSKKAEV